MIPIMISQNFNPYWSLSEIVFQVCSSHLLTKTHRQYLQRILLQGNLSEEDRNAVDRLFHGVRRGWLKLDD